MMILIIGGTGLLGSEAARELIKRGHEVVALALPPVPTGADLPPEMQIEFGDYTKLTDEEIRQHLDSCEGLLFAAGVDERIESAPPIYDLFEKYNITPLRRLLGLAKDCGVRHVAICGSYFSYFAKAWPEQELTKWHPYIRSRIDQEEMALSFADETMDVAVLELPYIFGTQPGRKPVWVFLVEMIQKMKPFTFFPNGGTAMLTVRQVAEALAGALERNQGGHAYPIGWDNLTWKELLTIFHKYMGEPRKKIVTIPKWMFALGTKRIMAKQKKGGIEGGLNMAKLPDIMCAEAFIDKELGCVPLGVTDDDIDAAIVESVRLSMEFLQGKANMVDMKGE